MIFKYYIQNVEIFFDGITFSITFTLMGKLIFKSTKLPEEVIASIKTDVKNKKFKSDNNAIVNILAKHYKIKKKNF